MTTVPQDEAPGEVKRTKSDGQVREQPSSEFTSVKAVAELLLGFGSLDVPPIVAVLVIVPPGAALTFTTRVIDTDPMVEIGPSEQLTVPTLPTGGVLQVPGLVSETKVVPAGMMSVKVAPASESGPLFVMTIV